MTTAAITTISQSATLNCHDVTRDDDADDSALTAHKSTRIIILKICLRHKMLATEKDEIKKKRKMCSACIQKVTKSLLIYITGRYKKVIHQVLVITASRIDRVVKILSLRQSAVDLQICKCHF